MVAEERQTAGKRYWLFKSEPDVFSFADLLASPDHTTRWDGVRNFQARNLLRDEIHVGDRVLFYHSSREPMAIVGTAEVVREGYPDPTAFDAASPYFDPRSDPARPTWYSVDVRAIREFAEPITRERLKLQAELEGMLLLKKGSRLSVQPVSPEEWALVCRLAGIDASTGA